MMTNGAVVLQVIEKICNGGDLALADTLFTVDYINHGGLIPDAIRGPEAIKFSIALYRAAFPNFRITVNDMAMDENTVAVRWLARAMPFAARTGNSLTDAPGELSGMTFSHLVRGQIIESWTCWDTHHLPRFEATPYAK